jgi:hypothetical protein
MVKPIVTYRLLEDLDACEEAISDFKKLFPFGAEVCQDSLTRAVMHGDLELQWLFADKSLIREAGLDKITIRKGFVTLKDGLFHSFKKRPSLVRVINGSFVTLAWHKHGKQNAYATVDIDRNSYSFSGGRLGNKKKRRGLEAAIQFSHLLAITRDLPEKLRAAIAELRQQTVETRRQINTYHENRRPS